MPLIWSYNGSLWKRYLQEALKSRLVVNLHYHVYEIVVISEPDKYGTASGITLTWLGIYAHLYLYSGNSICGQYRFVRGAHCYNHNLCSLQICALMKTNKTIHLFRIKLVITQVTLKDLVYVTIFRAFVNSV